jgi:hypothetical protein
MKKRLTLLILPALIALGLTVAAPITAAAYNPLDAACSNSSVKSSGSSVCQTSSTDTLTGPNGTINRVTRLVAVIAGIIAVLVIIIGGLMYITSNGDSGKISNAKNTIIYALIGLVVIVLSQSIITFVVSKI